MPPRATCHRGCPWLDLAVGLAGLGYAPFPLGPGKRPLVPWGAFHVEAPSWRVLYNDWWPAWQRAEGVGLIAGRPHDLVVLDFDDEASWSWALEHLHADRGVKTRRGGHLHFAHPARGIVGNRSGQRALTLAAGVRCDVKGLGGMVVGPYSHHPSGHVYEPLGDWRRPVDELPDLPGPVARLAVDHPPGPSAPMPPPGRRRGSEPLRAVEQYLAKVGGIPPEKSGSDEAVFRAAAWCKANVPEIEESDFVAAVRRERPEFNERWVAAKWRSAKGR